MAPRPRKPSVPPTSAATGRAPLRRIVRQFDLKLVTRSQLDWRRKPCGRGFAYCDADGRPIPPEDLARLKSLAVPPAYRNVRYAAEPRAHLQAIGEDAAGRLQYRYHPDWTRVREALKALRLAGMAQALPAIARAVNRGLKRPEPDRHFALAAAVQLVSLTAIRAGHEAYAQENGTHGATTLLKSHVRIDGEVVTLRFRGKGGKAIVKETSHAGLAAALARLKALPGRRLFVSREADGTLRPVRAGEVNAFLKATSGQAISLKDFRTLTACLGAIEHLVKVVPATSEAGRRRQIKAAVVPLAETLANTVTVCRSSYVHEAVFAAFEDGTLVRLARPARMRSDRSRAELLAELLSSSAGRKGPPPATRAPDAETAISLAAAGVAAKAATGRSGPSAKIPARRSRPPAATAAAAG